MPDEHSRYGASSMSRWSVCPGSVALLEQYPTQTSHHAQEGTEAHNWAEVKLNRAIAGEEIPVCPDGDMEDHLNGYVSYCMGLLEQNSDGYRVEGQFSLNHIQAKHGRVFGTNDFCCWKEFEILHVVDLKYGKHKVKAMGNKQLMFYALGAIRECKIDPVLIYLHIYQPRAGKRKPYDYHEISIGELLSFEAELKAAIKRVDEEPEVYVTGSHCYFCNRNKCPEQLRIEHEGSPAIEDTIYFEGN